MKKKWLVVKSITDELKNKFPEINPIILQLLHNRKLETQEAIDEFLNPDYGQDIHDPFLFQDMKKAVDRIFSAIENGEKITVHGDYDADGVCASAVAVLTLQALGADVNVYIPHRMTEGYGLNDNTVDELEKIGTKLVVTVDCGIANKDEIKHAGNKGIDVIVTDHHVEPPEIPDAFAIINPHLSREEYPFKLLAGAGVAFKLAQALIQQDGGKKIKDGFEKWLLDLVAIGTIGDMVPLIGENRTLCRYGMIVTRKSRRVGIHALVESSRFELEDIDTYNLSFGIVPRLNAAGRLDHANTAYKLLITDDSAEAKELAKDLEETNKERQRITEKLMKASREQVEVSDDKKLLYAIGEGWELGVVGLVAGRLSDEFSRPALVMGIRGDEVVGSGRSIPSFDITEALVGCRNLLERFGGHAAACGFTLQRKNVDSFIECMEKTAQQQITDEQLVKSIQIDVALSLADVSWELVESLETFEPFGTGNTRSRFVTYGLEITELRTVGKGDKHMKLVVRQGDTYRKIIAFGFSEQWKDQLNVGDSIDGVYEASFNEWNGNRELQLKLLDVRLSE